MKNKIFIIALASVSLLSSIRGMKTRNGEFTKEHFGTRQPKGLQKIHKKAKQGNQHGKNHALSKEEVGQPEQGNKNGQKKVMLVQ